MKIQAFRQFAKPTNTRFIGAIVDKHDLTNLGPDLRDAADKVEIGVEGDNHSADGFASRCAATSVAEISFSHIQSVIDTYPVEIRAHLLRLLVPGGLE